MQSLDERARHLLLADPEVNAALESMAIAAASIAVLEEESFVRVLAARGYPENLLKAFTRFPVNEPVPLAEAIRTGQPVWIASAEEWSMRYPSSLSTFTSSADRQGLAAIPFELAATRGAMGLNFFRRQPITSELQDRVEQFVHGLSERLIYVAA